MNAEILTVGTELLLGDILNSNSQFLSRELAAYGIQLLYQSTVGDNNARLKQVLSLALSRSDMVVITGGLGPTPDDLTRETVCEVLDIPLMLHEESWARIQEYFANTGRELSPSNKKQAMLPEGCVVFPNDHGTAPGCAIERDGHVVILLPGPPAELIPMFNDKVAPYLSKFSGGTIFSQTVGVFGIPESTVAERLADLLSEANPTVAPYAKDGEVTLRVTARAADTETARTLCAPIVEEIRKRLGAAVYGVDSGSLQKAVVTLLKEKGKKIATAESCTAGMLSGRLLSLNAASPPIPRKSSIRFSACPRSCWRNTGPSAPRWPAPWPSAPGGWARPTWASVSPGSPGRKPARASRWVPCLLPWRMKSAPG